MRGIVGGEDTMSVGIWVLPSNIFFTTSNLEQCFYPPNRNVCYDETVSL
jgi:hypothetical protein